MTMPTAPGLRQIQIPDAQPPYLTRMIAHALSPEIVQDEITKQLVRREDPVAWLVGKPHPLVAKTTIFRMFAARGGVEIYSLSEDRRTGIRDFIPMSQIRLIGEEMPLDVFVEELAAAEAGEDDDDEPDPTGPDEIPELDPPNGQTAASS